MPCYKPLYRIEYPEIKIKTKSGKITNKADVISEFEMKIKGYNKDMKNIKQIPCGQCIGCRLEYSRQWANRITLEAKKYKPEECWFLTLTYNDENVPISEQGGITLDKKDLQNFLKKLRRQYEYKYNHKGIRFYACGEYGETTQRPHYHICLFNMPINTELKKLKINEIGQTIWTNEEIEKVWGKGHIAIAKQSWETAAYTARYMMKKQKGKDAEWYYKSKGIKPEFTQMSLKPGIGKEYYEENKEKIYKNDEIIIKKGKGTIKTKPPKYYDTLYDIENPEKLKKIKEKREEFAREAMKTKQTRTNKTEEEIRKTEENNKKNQIRKLKRQL